LDQIRYNVKNTGGEMNEAEFQVRKLEALLKAYVEICEKWARASAGENKGMLAAAMKFLERRIKIAAF
jgi:hypothetical protein